MIFIGVDPGQKGALAFIDELNPEVPMFIDMPNLVGRKGHEGIALDADLLRKQIIKAIEGEDEVVAYVEEQHVFHQKLNSKGIKTFFADFGGVVATLQIVGIPYELVKPTTWQSGLGKPKTKEGSIWLAKKLFPKAWLMKPKARTDSDGRADALLLAEFGRRHYKLKQRRSK